MVGIDRLYYSFSLRKSILKALNWWHLMHLTKICMLAGLYTLSKRLTGSENFFVQFYMDYFRFSSSIFYLVLIYKTIITKRNFNMLFTHLPFIISQSSKLFPVLIKSWFVACSLIHVWLDKIIFLKLFPYALYIIKNAKQLSNMTILIYALEKYKYNLFRREI